MAEYLLPKARCVETGQTVKSQDLTNNRFTLGQRSQAQEVADQLAVKIEQEISRKVLLKTQKNYFLPQEQVKSLIIYEEIQDKTIKNPTI